MQRRVNSRKQVQSLRHLETLLLLLRRFSRVRLVQPHRRQPTRLPRPWDSPGKNTGAGFHFLLQCMKVKRESEVSQLCPTLSDPMDCSLPGSSVHGIFQARVLEWVAILLYYSMPKNTPQARPSIGLRCFLSLRDQRLGLPDGKCLKNCCFMFFA